MQQYATRPSWNNQGTEEMKNSLTHFERKLASNLTLVQVVGKRGRRVPIIISKEVKETMDMLILTRIKAGVQNENPYIFAIPGTSKSHMRGHDCVKKWCTEAQLQSPELITGTKLRKYIATVCQVFDLTENEQDWLARHLGHDIRVHREFYRLQENAVELTKVSRLLLAVDQGEAQTFSGMKLKDINIEDLPAIGEETNDDSEKEMRDDASEGETRDDASEGDDKLEPGDEARSDSEHCFINKTKRGNGVSKNKVDEKRPNKRACTKTPWSAEEKEIVLREMRLFIKKNNLPGKEKCSNLLENYPALGNRKWTDIKFFVKNYLAKNKK
ncbi:hypothetical protein JTB14_006795 [Gonioctena quinquepunctata]|nr:hypothetical protein JTB14_006795 [Gonioctena quinquepunctata]